MHRVIYRVVFCAGLLTANIASATESGFALESFTDVDRDRPVLIDWWYPVTGQAASRFDYGLGQGRVVEGGTITAGRFPLILLSHGALGAARNYSWIAEHLARNGFIVAGVSHFGESYVYGEDSIDPAAVLQHWQRPADISTALSHISTISTFADAVDLDRVGYLGHSSGGATGLLLAGALLDGRRMQSYCQSDAADDDRGCDYADDIGAGSTAPAQDPAQSYRDARIRAFALLDPALGPAFHDYSAIAANLPVLIIGSADNDFLPLSHHGAAIATHLPHSNTHWLANGEGHFIYLNLCARDIAANGVALCRDRDGVSRQAAHAALRSRLLTFLRDAL